MGRSGGGGVRGVMNINLGARADERGLNSLAEEPMMMPRERPSNANHMYRFGGYVRGCKTL